METIISKANSIKIATINLLNFNIDNVNLINYIVANADYLCVQELNNIVTPNFTERVVRLFKTYGYVCYRDKHQTDIAIFAKLSPLTVSYRRLVNTTQNRGVLIFEADHFKLATSRLENGGTGSGNRYKQIDEIGKICGDGIYIFAGDTCIPAWQTDLLLPKPAGGASSWYDAWREKGSSDNERIDDNGDRTSRMWYTNVNCEKYTVVDKCVIAEFAML